MLERRGLDPPSALLGLWEWRDGTATEGNVTLGDLWLVPGFYLLSHHDAGLNYDAFVKDPRWDAAWLPVLADGGGDFLAVDCSRGQRHGAVFHFRIEESEHPLEYENIERMLATFAVAFSQGAFYVDAEGYLEQDSESYASLARQLNPAVAWWNDPVG